MAKAGTICIECDSRNVRNVPVIGEGILECLDCGEYFASDDYELEYIEHTRERRAAREWQE